MAQLLTVLKLVMHSRGGLHPRASVVAIALCVVASGASADPVTWTGPDGSVHHYELVPSINAGGINWYEADAAARARTFMSLTGHLATITSAEELAFVFSNFSGDTNLGYWLGGFQPAGSVEPDGGWTWVTDEPWAFTNWAPPFEPNNLRNEDGVVMLGVNSFWNDAVRASDLYSHFLVEYTAAVAEPLPVLLVIVAGVLLLHRRKALAR